MDFIAAHVFESILFALGLLILLWGVFSPTPETGILRERFLNAISQEKIDEWNLRSTLKFLCFFLGAFFLLVLVAMLLSPRFSSPHLPLSEFSMAFFLLWAVLDLLVLLEKVRSLGSQSVEFDAEGIFNLYRRIIIVSFACTFFFGAVGGYAEDQAREEKFFLLECCRSQKSAQSKKCKPSISKPLGQPELTSANVY